MDYSKEKTVGAALAALLAVSILTGCSDTSQQESGSDLPEANTPGQMEYDNSYLMDGAIPIYLTGDGADCSDSGVRTDGATISIISGGVYYLSGTLHNGQILVNAPEGETVQLVLAGVSLSGAGRSAVAVEQADKVIVTLAPESENSITDLSAYNEAEQFDNAAVSSRVDLMINGSGTLEITGNHHNGIVSDQKLEVSGGSLRISAVENALCGASVLIVDHPALVLDAGGHGIRSTDPSGATELYGGVFDITAGDAISSSGSLRITGGAYTLISQSAFPMDEDTEYSVRKGLSADGALSIESGTFHMECSDDAVYGASVTISGGDMVIHAGSTAFYADYSMTISGGTLTSASDIGLEAANITINSGHISLVTQRSGISVNGSMRSGQRYLTINGGFVSCQSNGSALQINGNLLLAGGTVILNGDPEAEDILYRCSGTSEFSGGTLVAAGNGAGLEIAVAGSSTQPVLAVGFTQMQPEERLVHLQKTTGREIITFSPFYNYRGLLFSSPLMIDGESCFLYTGGTAGGAQVSGLYSDTTYTPGDMIGEITLTGTLTRYEAGDADEQD